MTKSGVVEKGKTPSVRSGRPSELIKRGEAVCRGESPAPTPERLRGQIPLTEDELHGQ